MKIEDFDSVIRSEARKVGQACGVDVADLEQEMREQVLLHADIVDAAGPAMARTIARRWGTRLRRRNMSRPTMLAGPASDGTMGRTPTAMWGPEEHVEREAEDATLARLAPEIEASRASHRPLDTVRAGLRRSDWIVRLAAKDSRFSRSIIEGAVGAMSLAPPTPNQDARKAWRADAFRKGAGARIADFSRGQFATKRPKEPLAPSTYPTDDEARRSHSRAALASQYDGETVERILAARDAYMTGNYIKEAQYKAICARQMEGRKENAASEDDGYFLPPDSGKALKFAV